MKIKILASKSRSMAWRETRESTGKAQKNAFPRSTK